MIQDWFNAITLDAVLMGLVFAGLCTSMYFNVMLLDIIDNLRGRNG